MPPPARLPSHLYCGSLLTDALKVITEVTGMLQHSLVQLENLQKLTELQRDLVGMENLITPGRVSDWELFELVTSLFWSSYNSRTTELSLSKCAT